MVEILSIIVRILAGWFGVAFIVAGAWVMLTAAGHRDRAAVVAALGIMFLGGTLIWRAFI